MKNAQAEHGRRERGRRVLVYALVLLVGGAAARGVDASRASRLAQVATATPVPAMSDLELGEVVITSRPGVVCGRTARGLLFRFANVGHGPASGFLVRAGDRWLAGGRVAAGANGWVWFDGLTSTDVLRVVVDDADQVLELDEGNNERTARPDEGPIPNWPTCTPTAVATGPRPTATARPDLLAEILSVSVAPDWRCEDTPVLGLRAQFRFEDGVDTPAFVVTTNGTPRAHDGRAFRSRGTTWVPGFRAEGGNELVVDAAEQVDEADETNNHLAGGTPLPLPTLPPCPPGPNPEDLPDLVIGDTRWVHKGFNGICIPADEGIELRLAVWNRGGSTAGPFLVRMRTSGRTWRVEGLAPGTVVRLEPQSGWRAGDFPLEIEVDPDNEVPESDETNNRRSLPTPPPFTPPPFCTATPTGGGPTVTSRVPTPTGTVPSTTATPTADPVYVPLSIREAR